MDSFHSTLQAIKWVSSVDQYIYSTLYILLFLSLLYIIIYLNIFNIANNQVSICPWSYIQPVILETSTQSWLKEHFEIFLQERNEEGRGGGRALPIPTNVRTGEQPRRTTRVLDKIYLGIYTHYIQYISKSHYILYIRAFEQVSNMGFRQDVGIYELLKESLSRLLGIP